MNINQKESEQDAREWNLEKYGGRYNNTSYQCCINGVLTHIRQRAHVHKRAWMMHHRHYVHQQMLFLFLMRTFCWLADVEVEEGVDYKRRAAQMVGMRDNADEMILEE